MKGERIQSVNEGLPEIINEVSSDPVVSEKALISVVSFATESKVEIPLSRGYEISHCPTLVAKGQTNYSKAISVLQETIAHDVAGLKASGFTVLRPFVYFITDGRPGDSWRRAHAAWTDRLLNKTAPNIMCFGVADADAEILRRFSTRFVFIAAEGVSASLALREVMKYIPATIIATAGHPQAQMPKPVSTDNFLVIDILDD